MLYDSAKLRHCARVHQPENWSGGSRVTMPDENKIRDAADAVKGVVEAVPIYQDALQPAAQELGKALQTVAKTLHIALAPVSALVWGYEQIVAFVETRVAEKLKDVPPERIVTPPPNVAGPALEALRYTGEEPTLREMYANLLATALDGDTVREAHPAFVEIIRQLTPDEARLLSLFTEGRRSPLIDLRVETEGQQGGLTPYRNLSLLGIEAGCSHPDLTPNYLDNLSRLGLITIPLIGHYTDPHAYDELENHPGVQQLKAEYERVPGKVVKFTRKMLVVTALGSQFFNACVLERDRTERQAEPAEPEGGSVGSG